MLRAKGHNVTGADVVDGPVDLGRVAGDVDAAFIASPTPLHLEHAMEFILKRVPVLIEKPIALNLYQAKTIETASNVFKVPVAVGYQERFNPAFRDFHDEMYHPGYLDILRQGPTPQGNYGTVGLDLGSHDLDLLRYVYGDDLVVHKSVDLDDEMRYAFEVPRYSVFGEVVARYLGHNELSSRLWRWRGSDNVVIDLLNQVVITNGSTPRRFSASTLEREHEAFFDLITGNRSRICQVADAVVDLKHAMNGG